MQIIKGKTGDLFSQTDILLPDIRKKLHLSPLFLKYFRNLSFRIIYKVGSLTLPIKRIVFVEFSTIANIKG